MLEAAPGIVVERVESWSTPGFPDVSGCWKEQDFWLELKILRNYRVGMRPAQVRWLRRRWKAGSRCFVLIYGDVGNALYLYHGDRAGVLTRKPISTTDCSIHFLTAESIYYMLKTICFYDD